MAPARRRHAVSGDGGGVSKMSSAAARRTALLLEPKKWRGTTKKISGDRCPPHFCAGLVPATTFQFVPAPLITNSLNNRLNM